MIQGMREILQDPEAPVRVEMDYPVKNYAAVQEVEEDEGRVVV